MFPVPGIVRLSNHKVTIALIGWGDQLQNDLLCAGWTDEAFKGQSCQLDTFCHAGLTYRSNVHFLFLTFGHSGAQP